MIFGEPGVDPRIQPLHRFDDDSGLSWASTYHSYQPHLGFRHFWTRGDMAPDPRHSWVPDAELHAFAFVVPGNDHTSVVPEDWNGWLPPHPERQPTAQPKTKKKRVAPQAAKISDEVARRMQSQLQSATRGVSLRKIFGKYDTDRSGTLTATELKKLIRKELRISTAVISDADVENLATALDGDRTGNISVDELLSFIERGTASFFTTARSKEGDEETKEEIPKSRDSSRGDDDDTDASEKKAPVGITQHESSKTILASTRHPYNRFIFRPLTPPLGGSLITLNTPRKAELRKATLKATRKASLSRAKDLGGENECQEDSQSDPKADAVGSAYWLGKAKGRLQPHRKARHKHLPAVSLTPPNKSVQT